MLAELLPQHLSSAADACWGIRWFGRNPGAWMLLAELESLDLAQSAWNLSFLSP